MTNLLNSFYPYSPLDGMYVSEPLPEIIVDPSIINSLLRDRPTGDFTFPPPQCSLSANYVNKKKRKNRKKK
jgi:hypothetical protein